jgi:glycerate 2-kinase
VVNFVPVFAGGGSALLPSPIPPITLDELVRVSRLLTRRGATSQQLNTVRRHLEMLKGGGLAKTAYPAQVAYRNNGVQLLKRKFLLAEWPF